MSVTREHILSEIRRTAAENEGVALGKERFFAATGIKESDWSGRHWARWGDAVAEAGLVPNRLNTSRSDEDLLGHLAALVKELGRFPVISELRLKARADENFPHANTLRNRFGSQEALLARLRQFLAHRGDTGLLAIIPALETTQSATFEAPEEIAFGDVYLLKSGHFYKIGRSNAVGRRERELAIQLPEKAIVVHSIKTDDPPGIEAYWHRRFEARRKNGEWFDLSPQDVAAFRRRKFMRCAR